MDLDRYIVTFREMTHQYALFLTRFTGRGIIYLFLGSMVFGSLWDNNISPFLGFIFSGIIAAVAIASLVFGISACRALRAYTYCTLMQCKSDLLYRPSLCTLFFSFSSRTKNIYNKPTGQATA